MSTVRVITSVFAYPHASSSSLRPPRSRVPGTHVPVQPPVRVPDPSPFRRRYAGPLVLDHQADPAGRRPLETHRHRLAFRAVPVLDQLAHARDQNAERIHGRHRVAMAAARRVADPRGLVEDLPRAGVDNAAPWRLRLRHPCVQHRHETIHHRAVQRVGHQDRSPLRLAQPQLHERRAERGARAAVPIGASAIPAFIHPDGRSFPRRSRRAAKTSSTNQRRLSAVGRDSSGGRGASDCGGSRACGGWRNSGPRHGRGTRPREPGPLRGHNAIRVRARQGDRMEAVSGTAALSAAPAAVEQLSPVDRTDPCPVTRPSASPVPFARVPAPAESAGTRRRRRTGGRPGRRSTASAVARA